MEAICIELGMRRVCVTGCCGVSAFVQFGALGKIPRQAWPIARIELVSTVKTGLGAEA